MQTVETVQSVDCTVQSAETAQGAFDFACVYYDNAMPFLPVYIPNVISLLYITLIYCKRIADVVRTSVA